MTYYQIIGPSFDCTLLEDVGNILEIEGCLADWQGQQFSDLRRFAEQWGWIVRPLQPPRCISITHEDAEYLFGWQEGRIVRITRVTQDETKDITLRELPAVVRDLL